jgi:hypothetical protein
VRRPPRKARCCVRAGASILEFQSEIPQKRQPPFGEAPRMLRASENFAFLSHTDAQLARLGALAEWSLHVDPPTTIQKLRIFTEVLARLVAARQGECNILGGKHDASSKARATPPRMPTKDQFQAEIRSQLRQAELRGASSLEITSGELHRQLGGYPASGGSHQMPSCCDAMYDEKGMGDKIISAPPKGKAASLTIRYVLPRRGR